MKRLKNALISAVLIISVGLIFSFNSFAKLPIDETVESSRDSGTDLYEGTKFHNVLDLNITISDGSSSSTLLDESYSTSLSLAPGTTITVSCDTKMHGTFIVWDSLVPEWTLTIGSNTYTYGTYGFIHEYIELPEETNSFTITIADSSTLDYKSGAVYGMRISDIYAFDSADLPDWVQTWEPPTDSADILIMCSHADDEDIFFGGIGPIYSAEQGLVVQMVFFENHWTYEATSKIREHEKLCGMWCSGMKYYPITSDFGDAYSESVEGATQTISWDYAVNFAVDCIRRTHPLVVVTHDVGGEYGHGQHMLTSAATLEAIVKAADSSYLPESAEEYGIWNTPKVYVHLWETNALELDMRSPLSAFDGKTAIEVARQAYKCHESQQYCWFTVDDYGPYSNASFGLYYSTVGLDENHNDFMENLTSDNIDTVRTNAAKETGVTYIYTPEDMELLRTDNFGSFKLMNDIDMSGIDWVPVTFCGTFNGNGNAILNLNVTQTGASTRTTYDGNMKTYDTSFAGLFDVLEGATITNLTLLGVNVDITADTDCFVGTIAGFAENTTIENCVIEGQASLFVNGKMFGVGGIVGFAGASSFSNVDVTVVLINVDLDASTRDEQFMGGAFGAGYVDVDNCLIRIAGYDSDHGYVHDGGLTGMYMFYPAGTSYYGSITNTRVEGFIRFFEDNTDRRAYCSDFEGEVLNWDFKNSGNSSDFTRDEVFEYDTNLLPHYCENPTYTANRVAVDCSGYSYTVYTCDLCNEYSYKGDYEVPVHNPGEEIIVVEPTYEECGLSKYKCNDCGKYTYEITPVLVKIEITSVSEVGDSSASNNSAVSDNNINQESNTLKTVLLVSSGIAVLGAGGFAAAKLSNKSSRRKRRHKSRHKNNRKTPNRNSKSSPRRKPSSGSNERNHRSGNRPKRNY